MLNKRTLVLISALMIGASITPSLAEEVPPGKQQAIRCTVHREWTPAPGEPWPLIIVCQIVDDPLPVVTANEQSGSRAAERAPEVVGHREFGGRTALRGTIAEPGSSSIDTHHPLP